MTGGGHRAHIAEALRWSPHTPRSGWQAAAAGVGMAVPVALGLALGRPAEGFAAAVGAILNLTPFQEANGTEGKSNLTPF